MVMILRFVQNDRKNERCRPNTNGVVILHSKMTGAVSVLAAHCTRSLRDANHQLGAKYLLTPASYDRI